MLDSLKNSNEKIKENLETKVDNDTFESEIANLKDLLNQLLNKGGDVPTVDINAGNSALKSMVDKLLDRLKDLEKRVEMNEGDITKHTSEIEEILALLALKADKSDLKKM